MCYTSDFDHLRISVHFRLTYLRLYSYDETICQTTNAHYNNYNTNNYVNNRNNHWAKSIRTKLVSVQICRDFSFPMAFEIWRKNFLEVLQNHFQNLHDCKFHVLMFLQLSFWTMSWSGPSYPLWCLMLSPYYSLLLSTLMSLIT